MKITNGMANSDGATLQMVDVGLTKREYFVLEILKVLLARPDEARVQGIQELVGLALDVTDHLMGEYA